MHVTCVTLFLLYSYETIIIFKKFNLKFLFKRRNTSKTRPSAAVAFPLFSLLAHQGQHRANEVEWEPVRKTTQEATALIPDFNIIFHYKICTFRLITSFLTARFRRFLLEDDLHSFSNFSPSIRY